MRFREWLTRVMAGRNGADQLCRFLSFATMVFLLLSLLIRGTGLSSVFWVLGLLCFFRGIFRSLSRNLARRPPEPVRRRPQPVPPAEGIPLLPLPLLPDLAAGPPAQGPGADHLPSVR